jgi:hypothetical protein
MDHQSERIEFLVQGSSAEPYRVSFWRVGDKVKSSCTCQAGKNGLACKHRLSLLDGDVNNLVSSSPDGFQELQRILEGSDVGDALRELDNVTPQFHTLEKLLPLKPPGRRKSVTSDLLAQSLIQGGLIKGNQSYYDVFSPDLNYLGSVKVRRGTVFSENPHDYFSGLSLTVKRITDGLVWERSQSVYAASVGSPMALTLDGGIGKTIQQKSLKRALTD